MKERADNSEEEVVLLYSWAAAEEGLRWKDDDRMFKSWVANGLLLDLLSSEISSRKRGKSESREWGKEAEKEEFCFEIELKLV